MVRNLERQRRGRVEDLYLADDYLNFTGRQVRVGVTLRAGRDLASNFKYVFCAQIVGHLLTDDYLGNTAGITQVNKGDAAVVTTTIDPAGERYGSANVT